MDPEPEMTVVMREFVRFSRLDVDSDVYRLPATDESFDHVMRLPWGGVQIDWVGASK
jgi:hypothetical protein